MAFLPERTFRKASMGVKQLILVQNSYQIINTGGTILFEMKKGSLRAKRAFLSPKKAYNGIFW